MLPAIQSFNQALINLENISIEDRIAELSSTNTDRSAFFISKEVYEKLQAVSQRIALSDPALADRCKKEIDRNVSAIKSGLEGQAANRQLLGMPGINIAMAAFNTYSSTKYQEAMKGFMLSPTPGTPAALLNQPWYQFSLAAFGDAGK